MKHSTTCNCIAIFLLAGLMVQMIMTPAEEWTAVQQLLTRWGITICFTIWIGVGAIMEMLEKRL